MRFPALALTAALLLALLFATPARAANDPDLVWKTIETPRFRINYYSGEEATAQRVASLCEDIHARLSPILGWAPREKVEIALVDQTDSANGLTSGVPFNAITLYLTNPDDLSTLSDYDDWQTELITHEYTHTLHIDHIRGVPALINKLLGRTLIPNQAQPRWILEGLATFEESERTSGGRMRSSQWNMYMRADVLEDNVAPLDVFHGNPRRFPQGTIWYLYGSFFMRWIAQTYGDDAIRRIIEDYGRQLIPLGINRSVRRATGRTYEQLYPAFVATMRRTYQAQAAAIRARGLREGVRLTTGGNSAQHPRWVPDQAWPDKRGQLLYFRDDGHDTGGLYTLPIKRDERGEILGVDEARRELVIRTNVAASAGFTPEGGVVFDSVDFHRRIFGFNDLFYMPPGVKESLGLEGQRRRLSNGFRATDPDVSPDGKRVAFATNHRGTRYLQLADLGPIEEKGLTNVRALVRSEPRDQAFTPRWSPDNRHLAYGVWTPGGFRDIRYVDSWTGTYVEVTHDRAMDGGPSFTPDGKWLLFHSDRTGVMNVYAWEVATGRLRQVTNVVNGAYQPAVSPDGKTLAYLGFTHRGFDLYGMRFDPATWTDAEPHVDDRPAPPPEPIARRWPVQAYNPLETLRPRRYRVDIAPGNYGQAISTRVEGSDMAGFHGFGATLKTETEKPELQFDLGYSYARLPVDIGMRVFRGIAPRGGYSLGPDYKPVWTLENVGVQSSVSYGQPGSFDGQSMSMTYTAARMAGELPVPLDKLNPYDTPTIPVRGIIGSLGMGYGYSNAQRFLWSVGPEKGFSFNANFDVTHPALASDFTGFAASASFTSYFRMPWLRHHSLALRAGGGTGAGNFPGRGPFFVGGFVDLPLVDTVRNLLIQGGVALRGYAPVVEAGRNFVLLNGEYRFPIVNVDRGLSTLPLFLQRVTGALYVDYGSAFNDAAAANFKTGTGAELWFDTVLGYNFGLTFRLGYAHGWASGGLDKVYFVASVPF